jgi:hypothetical protein
VTTIEDIFRTEIPEFLRRTGKSSPRILEVGVIRDARVEYADGDGHSTPALMTLAMEYGGTYTGIDLDTSVAQRVMEERGKSCISTCTLLQGDSHSRMLDLIAQEAEFDILYLDGANDADVVLEDYRLALKLAARPALLLADDMNEDDEEVRKGVLLLPQLRKSGTEFRLLQRKTSWTNRDILVQEVK